MKVAIIGAGPAGLACAIQLERAGVTPDIFEINSRIGEKHEHVAAMLQITTRPIKDPILHLNDKYNLNIKPLNVNTRIVHYGPNSKSVITGNLGYFFYRGQEPISTECQLGSVVKSKINFNTYADYNKLRNEYDYVVVASGKRDEAKELGIWQNIVPTWVKGAIVLGDFDQNTLTVWINRDYCNAGYAYLTPINKHRASLILVVTEAEESEIDKYWDYFIAKENLKYEAVEYFTREHSAGYVYPHKVENLYFVGNSAGCIDPFLGFGQLAAITSGSEAARCILYGLNYESQLSKVISTNIKLGEFRRALNTLNNTGLDLLVKSIGLPGVNALVYKTNINYLNLGSFAVRAVDKLFGDRV